VPIPWRDTSACDRFDLKVFFTVVAKDPLEVKRSDVMAFIKSQRFGPTDGNVIVFPGANTGLALSTIRRRLRSLSGFYTHLVPLDRMAANPVQRGTAVRPPVTRDKRVVPVVRPVRKLPRILEVDEGQSPEMWSLSQFQRKKDKAT
jgi:integrase/recombinase XerD